jgi:serine/threonine protein kinase
VSRSDFPIGVELDAGRYVIRDHLRGEPARGMYRATAEGTSRTMLVTLGTRQKRTYEQLRSDLSLDLAGIACLRYIGPVGTEHDAMVEEEPEGHPADRLPLPLTPALALDIALGIGTVLAAAHATGVWLRHLRPELIYVTEREKRFGVSGIAPRGEEFLKTAAPPCYGVPPMYSSIYLAPELIRLKEAGAATDVFALGAVLAHWLSGAPPFQGEDPGTQMLAIHAGKRRPWTGPARLSEIIDHALADDPQARPRLPDFLDELRQRALAT